MYGVFEINQYGDPKQVSRNFNTMREAKNHLRQLMKEYPDNYYVDVVDDNVKTNFKPPFTHL